MKSSLVLVALLSLAPLVRAESTLEATVTGFPADTTELLFFVDVVGAAEGPGYEEPAAAVAPPAPQLPVALPNAAGQPAAAAAPADLSIPANQPQQPRRRRGPAKPPFNARGAVKPNGPTATWSVAAPAGTNYRVRVAAIKGEGTFPTLIAGGKAAGLKLEADKKTAAAVTLNAPSLKLAADNPTTLTVGAPFKLSGVLHDPGNFLGTKNRMRVWMSAGQRPTANQAGTQVSTVDVETKDEAVSFNLELVAPREAGPLYVQFGETSADFNRPDGKQVPLFVFPDLSAGAKPIELRIEPAKVANAPAR